MSAPARRAAGSSGRAPRYGPDRVHLRSITEDDRPFVLALNAESVHQLAPMDDERLDRLLGWASHALIAEVGSEAVGFVLLFGPGSAYDSDNYRWFGDRYDSFCYLDRVVIAPAHRRKGFGSALYDLVEPLGDPLVLEVNARPANEPSLAFHSARGFVTVGERVVDGGEKLLAMMVKPAG